MACPDRGARRGDERPRYGDIVQDTLTTPAVVPALSCIAAIDGLDGCQCPSQCSMGKAWAFLPPTVQRVGIVKKEATE